MKFMLKKHGPMSRRQFSIELERMLKDYETLQWIGEGGSSKEAELDLMCNVLYESSGIKDQTRDSRQGMLNSFEWPTSSYEDADPDPTKFYWYTISITWDPSA
jgi:hypothetical protein